MKFTAQQIAGILEGDVVGDPNVEVSKLAKIEEGTKGTLTFLANPKYKPYIYSTEASITIVDKLTINLPYKTTANSKKVQRAKNYHYRQKTKKNRRELVNILIFVSYFFCLLL